MLTIAGGRYGPPLSSRIFPWTPVPRALITRACLANGSERLRSGAQTRTRCVLQTRGGALGEVPRERGFGAAALATPRGAHA